MSALKSIVEAAARARKIYLDSFTFNAVFLTLTASGTTPFTIPIQADSDFFWEATNLTCFTSAGVFDPNPDLLIAFTDIGSGRNLQDQPMHVFNVTGNGSWPFILPEPKILIGNGGVTINLTNNTVVAKGRVDIALIGAKIFYTSGYDRSKLLAGI